MKPAKRNVLAVAAAFVLAFLAVTPSLAVAKKKAKEPKGPKLEITKAHLTGVGYAFKDDPPAFIGFEDVTENTGGATAPPSKTELLIVHADIRRRVAVRHVKALAPGKKDAGERFARWAGVRTLPLGAYSLYVCANENNKRCKRIRGKFYVINKTWDGSFSGQGQWPLQEGARESWGSPNLKFTFNGGGGGAYLYTMSGTVRFQDEGTTSGGCTYSGSYVLGNPSGTLTLDYAHENYAGLAVTSPNLYPVQTTCGDTSGPTFYNYLNTSRADGSPQPLPFGTELLQGST